MGEEERHAIRLSRTRSCACCTERIDRVRSDARRDTIEHHAVSTLKWVGRVGYLAKGLIYVAVGVLSTMAAWGLGDAEGSHGALRSLRSEPLGQFLLLILAAGLFSYTIWHIFEAFLDQRDESKKKAVARRIALVANGLVYAALGYSAGRLALSSSDESGGATDYTADLLALPFGAWIVAGVGVIVIAFGAWQIRRMTEADFMDQYDDARLGPRSRRIVKSLGCFGLSARGFVLCIIGAFLLDAAWKTDPDNAKGLSQVLEVLASQPFGSVLLVVTAVGLGAYGLYCVSVSVYGDFET